MEKATTLLILLQGKIRGQRCNKSTTYSSFIRTSISFFLNTYFKKYKTLKKNQIKGISIVFSFSENSSIILFMYLIKMWLNKFDTGGTCCLLVLSKPKHLFPGTLFVAFACRNKMKCFSLIVFYT